MVPRHDRTNREPQRRWIVLAALVCLAGLAGCGQEPQGNVRSASSAQVSLKVTMPPNVAAVASPAKGLWAKIQRWVWGSDAWAASVNEITGLVVRVTGPGIGSPIASPQVPVSEAVSGLVVPVTLEVPVGADRVFAVAAVNAANRPIFQGQSEPVTLTADQPATVAIQLTNTTLRILPNPLPDGTEDRPYTGRLQAERGTGLTWTVPAGKLPPGVRLDAATGALLGTPTRAGKFDFTIRVTDALGLFDEAQVTIRINPAPLVPRITTTTLPDGTVGASYRATLVAVDGTGVPTWSRSVGALPAGLNLDSDTGVISGTPTTEGRATFTVRATDTTPLSDEQVLTITINSAPVVPKITTTTLPDGTTEAKYNAQLTATGGTGKLTWSVVAGGLPDGLKLTDATGAITGTPMKNGTFTFTIRATDTIPLSDQQVLTITIKDAPKPPVITTESLPGGQVGAAYRATLTATSTNGAVRWSVIPAVNPAPGLLLNGATGAITGTPTTKGTFEFTVRATDAAGLFDEQLLFIQINDKPKPPVITTTTLPDGIVEIDDGESLTGRSYNATLKATGGTGALTWEVLGPSICFNCLLPPGLKLSSTGVITGVPTETGAWTFTVRVTDTAGQSDRRQLSITVTFPLQITTLDLPDGFVKFTYNDPEGSPGKPFELQARGGTPPYTWSVVPSMPEGLSLAADGTISGTPAGPGSISLNFTVKDSRGVMISKELKLVIQEFVIDGS